MKTIYFITSNKGKLVEFQQMLSTIDVKVVQKNLGYPEIQADKLEDVACYGAEYLQNKLNQPFILEDAGLFIKILNGFPGVYSSYVFRTIGCKGILNILEDKQKDERKAVFRSAVSYKKQDKPSIIFVGECYGSISKQESGTHGFGYDPIFIPDGETRTFAQMEVKEKNIYSHRGKSLKKLIDFFKNE